MKHTSIPTLYRAEYEHGSCGIGLVARTDAADQHRTVELALAAVARLEHRGAVAADGNSSDGSGILTTLPVRFLRDELAAQDIVPPSSTRLGAGMLFLPAEPVHAAERARAILTEELSAVGAEVYHWRVVPVDRTALGDVARSVMPRVEQVIFGFEHSDLSSSRDPLSDGASRDDEAERLLYTARRRAEKRFATEGAASAYVCSLSTRKIVYKGLVLATRLARFYPDLADRRFEARAAVFHQRFSTNTFPAWPLAQPLRAVAHNGEFNTLRGNLQWLHARQHAMSSELLGDTLAEVLPVVQPGDSDSAAFDRLFELLVRTGRDPAHVLSLLMPSESRPGASESIGAMQRYQAGVAEAWDGPAAIVGTDGRVAVAALDRNGLRPLRYQITDGGWICAASETGLLDPDTGTVVESDRLGPGRLIEIDLINGGVRKDYEIEADLAGKEPYADWLRARHAEAPTAEDEPMDEPEGEELQRLWKLHGWDKEDLDRVVLPMASTGKVPVGSMGDDAAIAPLSSVGQPLSRFFRQRFAQVTNPPLDPIRERCMFSLETPLGRHANMLEDGPRAVEQISFPSPVIDGHRFAWLRNEVAQKGSATRIEALFTPGIGAMKVRLDAIAEEVRAAAGEGAVLFILTDRSGPDDLRAPVPMLLVVAAVHAVLIGVGRRLDASIVCETADAREDHDIACLLGFGATLIYPYLAMASVRDANPDDPEGACARFIEAADAGLLKAMSRMGVSVLRSYRGAQLFETLGLDRAFVNHYFPGVPAPIGGHDASFFETQAAQWLAESRGEESIVERGRYRFRRGGESHGFAPATFTALHKAVRNSDGNAYQIYAKSCNEREPVSVRDLLELAPAGDPVPLDEVESIESIVKRFVTGAMSHGSLSREAHEVMAVAMNRLGGRSNSGEGGEASERFKPYREGAGPEGFLSQWKPEPGDWGASAIKQVASGRFGVSAAYLAAASEIEIKMAQGAKPGEGGQIPGFKVSEEIGALRGAAAGTTLISPPPHHDIYSIEDLAELIHDLKSVNRRARVAVKLVSTSGVGTIAAGVVKAHADVVQISGHEGGTGATPLSALKHVGMPWEIGLAETRQTLVLNGLRSRVRLRVDGGLRTGRDVAIAAALGADQFGFGTVALVAAGCIMARKCHENTCPVGVATQDPKLRAKFPGTPDHVISFMCFVAEELRHILASLGLRRVGELVGRSDLVRARAGAGEDFDLTEMLSPFDEPARKREARNDEVNPRGSLDDRILADASARIDAGVGMVRRYRIKNSDRAVGAGISGEIGRIHGPEGLPGGSFDLTIVGTSGQSFGAFCAPGVGLTLEGEAQDYVGKSMSGGRIVIRATAATGHGDRPPVVMGNTVLYGATGGELYAAGRSGERFGVRNSGATAIVEGCGEHGCEYMTGGTVVILGSIGRNFAAGMTGGKAFIHDPLARAALYLNDETVTLRPLDATRAEAEELRGLVDTFAAQTGSPRAASLLGRWEEALSEFVVTEIRGAASRSGERAVEAERVSG